jgi:hypothetical protein
VSAQSRTVGPHESLSGHVNTHFSLSTLKRHFWLSLALQFHLVCGERTLVHWASAPGHMPKHDAPEMHNDILPPPKEVRLKSPWVAVGAC